MCAVTHPEERDRHEKSHKGLGFSTVKHLLTPLLMRMHFDLRYETANREAGVENAPINANVSRRAETCERKCDSHLSGGLIGLRSVHKTF